MRVKYSLVTLSIVMAVWWILTKKYSSLVIPTIDSVFFKIIELLTTKEMVLEILLTLKRLLFALFFGSLSGFVVGFFCGVNTLFRKLMKPVISILQVTPPIALLIMAIMWFGFSGKPAIFISTLAIFPTLVISVQEGILNIDNKLIQMGKTFSLSKISVLKNIIIPSLSPHITTGWKISLGVACKTLVMGEVLTTTTGIGGNLSNARMNLEPEGVLAWTIITIILFYFIDWFVKILIIRKKEKYA
jgi:ABC-type nitrate/sulfonate/bicarbonate transport system permease component